MIGSKKYKLSEAGQQLYQKTYEIINSSKYPNVTNPCGEITLNAAGGYCVISDLVPFFCDTLNEVKTTAQLAVRFLIRTNLMDAIYSDEVKRTNRIGVGQTGIHEFAWKFFGYGFRDLIDENISQPFWNFIKELKETIEEEGCDYSDKLGLNHPHTFTTIKPSGCRPWYALTSTDKGILTLDEIFEDHEDGKDWSNVKKELYALQGNGKEKISKTYSNGKSEVLQIKLAYGLTVESTPEHLWFVKSYYENKQIIPVNKWIKAKDLTINDILDINLNVYTNKDHSKLKNIKTFALRMKGIPNIITQPSELNSDLSWMFGYLWGDGAMSPQSYRLRFTDANLYNLEKVNRIMKENFNIDGNIKPKDNTEKAFILDIGNKELWHWLIKNGVYKYFEDEIDLIPKIVRESSQEDIIAFIAGLIDADGCINIGVNDKTVTFTQANYKFSRHMQDVSWSIGLGFGLSHNTCGENWQKTRKSMYLMTLSSVTDLYSHSLLIKHSNKMIKANNEHLNLRWRMDHPDRKERRKLGKIESVKSLGIMDTYDIEVENNHWYYAGSVKSHNSISKLFALTEGAHLPAYRWYLRWIQFQNNDPLLEEYRSKGYPVKELKTYPNVSVVGFLTKPLICSLGMGDKLVTAQEATPEEQYKWLMLLEKYWLGENGNQVSYTLKCATDKMTLEEFRETFKKYQPLIRCCAVQPIISNEALKSAYEYLPEEEITEEEYNEIEAKINGTLEVVFNSEELMCAGGACPL